MEQRDVPSELSLERRRLESFHVKTCISCPRPISSHNASTGELPGHRVPARSRASSRRMTRSCRRAASAGSGGQKSWGDLYRVLRGFYGVLQGSPGFCGVLEGLPVLQGSAGFCRVLPTFFHVWVLRGSAGLVNFMRVDPGFDPAGLVTASFDPIVSGYPADGMPQLARRLVAAVRSVPGVTAAAVSRCGLVGRMLLGRRLRHRRCRAASRCRRTGSLLIILPPQAYGF